MKKIALSFCVLAASGAYVWSQWGDAGSLDLLAALPPPAASATDSAFALQPTAAAPAVPLVMRQTIRSRDDVPRAAVPPVVVLAPDKLAPTRTIPPPTAASEPPPLPTGPETTASVAVADSTPPPAPPVQPAPPTVADVPMPHLRPSHAQAASTPTLAATTVAQRMGVYADGSFTGPVVDAYYGYIQIQAIVQGGRLVDIRVLQYPSDRRTSVYINRQALPMLRDEVVAAQSANVDIISGATLTSEAFIRSLGSALQKASA